MIAEYTTSNWLQNLKADPAVRVRVAGFRFSASARVLTPGADPKLNADIQALSTKKYGWGDGLVVELVPDDQQTSV